MSISDWSSDVCSSDLGQERRGQSLRTGRQGHLHRCQSIGGGIVSDRLASRFAKCRAEGRAALVIFVTGGDPTPNDMAVVLDALVEGGADIIELGIPFKDPMAAKSEKSHAGKGWSSTFKLRW